MPAIEQYLWGAQFNPETDTAVLNYVLENIYRALNGFGAAWQTQKLTATTSQVSFVGIPPVATNIRIVWKATGTDAAAAVDFRGRINSVSSVAYSIENETVDGAVVSASNASATSFKVGSLVAAGSSTSASSGGVIEIPGYADGLLGGIPILTRCVYTQVASPAVTAKEEFDGEIYVVAAGTPVTRIDLFPSSGLLSVGSSFSLYLE